MGIRESGRYVVAYIQEVLPVADDDFTIEREGNRYDVFYTGGDEDYRQHVGMADSWCGAIREKETVKALDTWEFREFLSGEYSHDECDEPAAIDEENMKYDEEL